jgi:hypothetical protein
MQCKSFTKIGFRLRLHFFSTLDDQQAFTKSRTQNEREIDDQQASTKSRTQNEREIRHHQAQQSSNYLVPGLPTPLEI